MLNALEPFMSSFKEPPLLALERVGNFPLRIDWLGAEVIAASRRGVAGQFVKVACSKWELGSTWGGSGYEEVQHEALVPIAFLRRLRVGDIWHEGHRIGGAHLIRKPFEGLRIDRTTCEIVVAGGTSACSDGVARHEVPFANFVGHRGHTTSNIVKVRINETTSLLVPCTELLRRYFGDAGTLLSITFSGALAEGALYDKDASFIDSKEHIAHLQLGRGLTSHAASAVARIAFDPAAARAFRGLINAGVAAHVNKEPWLIKMHFPIEGRTDLDVRGLWLQRGPDRSFLVFKILSCSHAFPFKKLRYLLHPDQPGGARPGSAGQRDSGEKSAGRSRGPTPGLDHGPANQDLSPILLDAEDEPTDPFPDLAKKKVFRGNKDDGSRGASRPRHQFEDQPYASAVGAHSKEAPRAGEVIASRRLYGGGQPEPRSLLWLREELAYSVPEVRVRSPFDNSVATRKVVTRGNGFGLPAAIWATVFRYEAGPNVGRSFLCTVVETPASPKSIELLMFDLPAPHTLSEDDFKRFASLSFVSIDRLPVAAKEMELRIAWTADELTARDGSDLAVQMVETMLDSYNRNC